MQTNSPAVLVLEDGKIFRGFAMGASGATFGEAVFTTAMTGYQEALTDPSYYRQIPVMTAPHIGNTGWNGEDSQSRDGHIWAAGLIIRDLSHTVSNWRASHSLGEELQAQSIVGICGVDTRSLVRHLRDNGSLAAGIFSGSEIGTEEEMLAKVRQQPAMQGSDLSADVSTKEAYVVDAEGERRYTVVALDLGIRANTPQEFAQRGIRTVVVPAQTSFEQLQDYMKEYEAQAVFLSNGPGDPATADATVELVREILGADIPLFGSSFGHQIFGRALGLDTYKLTFGHHGNNVPVKDLATGKVAITAQNHGFAVQAPAGEQGQEFDTPFGAGKITHICLNDDVVEGLALSSGRAFSAQFHPESAADPHEANPLFDHLLRLLEQEKNS